MRPGDLLEQRYRLIRVLGRGRSGTVWCARNELIDRAVAIKVLHSQLASDPEKLQRFFQEARACGRVRHPAVVEVLDLGQGDDGVLFLVMELLEGETMASLLGRKGKLQVDEALALMVPIARGLAAAHTHGILHRDLKPANIYLHKTPTGGLQPKVLDFGISKILGTELTSSGVVLGTPSYMSPEQARGTELDARTDVWALGVILYECLAGRLPFLARDYRSLVAEITEQKPTPIRELAPDVTEDLAQVIDEALAKSRDKRLASALQFAQKLTFVLRRRGRDDLLRTAEDDLSDGAPTITQDRVSFSDRPPPPPPVPAEALAAQRSDSEITDAEVTQPRRTLPAPGIAPKASSDRKPSPLTASIAAQTGGAKRRDDDESMRPAAGAPIKGSFAADAETTMPTSAPAMDEGSQPRLTTSAWEVSSVREQVGRAEVLLGSGLPPKLPAVNVEWDTTVADVSHDRIVPQGAAPEVAGKSSAQRATTGSWETARKSEPVPSRPESAIIPASVRPSSVASSTPAPTMPSAPKAPAPIVSEPGRTLRPTAPDLAPPAERPSGSFASIPGFSAPTPVAPSVRPSTPPPANQLGKPALPAPRRSTPPPPPMAARKSTPPPPPAASASPAAAPAPSGKTAPPPPPRRSTPPPPPMAARKSTPPPPPMAAKKSVAPSAAPAPTATNVGGQKAVAVAHHEHKPTLRPPSDGFAVPAVVAGAPPPPRSAAPPPPRKSVAPAADRAGTPSLDAIFAPPPVETTPVHPPPSSEAAPFPLAQQPPTASPFELLRAPATSPTASDVAAAVQEDTSRARTRATLLRGRALLAAVGAVFGVGALIGTCAAASRGSTHAGSRFVAAETLIVAWHRAAGAIDDAETAQATERAKKEEADRQAAAAASAKAKAEAEAQAAASASAAAAASASAAPSASSPVGSKPGASGKPTTPPSKSTTGKPATSGKPPAKGAASAAPKKGYPTGGGDAPKKKSGEKEWWEKKF